MKAVLIDSKVTPPKTHDLVELGQLLSKTFPSWIWDESELLMLSQSAVLSRYPGRKANAAEVRACVELCKRLRQRLLGML
jgi:HEPN domain-containing protein